MKKLPLLCIVFLLFVWLSTMSQEATAQGVCPGAVTLPGSSVRVSGQKTSDGIYKSTGFGCGVEDDGTRIKDSLDNCVGYCGTPPECTTNGPECQWSLKWFAANEAQYGCFTKMKITNPANNKAVVVRIIDTGPNCTEVEEHGQIFDMSLNAAWYLDAGNYEDIYVEEVPESTPLGPTDGSGIPAPGGGTQGTAGSFTIRLKAKIRNDENGNPLALDTYLINRAEVTAVGGGATATSSGPVGGGGPPGPCGQAPAPPSNIAEEIKNKWGIVLNGVPQEQQQAIWEEFHEVDCTGILQDLRGAHITSNGSQGGTSRQDGFGVSLAIYDKQFTKGLIMHELTHVWQTMTPRGEANVLKIPAAYEAEGGISKYSRNECGNGYSVGDNWRNEDHADTIALYLNPSIGELTCGNGAPNPFAGGKYPLHAAIAKEAAGR